MRVNLDSQTWRSIDPEAVTNASGGIQHGASIVQNFRAIGEDAIHLVPNRFVVGPVAAAMHGKTFWDGLAAFGIGLIWDALDIITFPFMVLKNLGDITAHAVAYLVNKAKGQSDGTATAAEPYSYFDSDSAARLTWGYDRRGRDRGDDLRPLCDLKTATAHFYEINGRGLDVGDTQMANFNGAVKWQAKKAYRPGPSIDDLSAVMRDIRKTMPPGTKIKPGGSGHSFDSAATTGAYIHPEGMKFIETMRDGLVRLGAGVTLRQANVELWNRGRALPVLGGYDGQTVAGGLATGTHGNVLSQGPLCACVRSMDLVRVDGSQVRVEPKNGITNPAAFAKEHPGMQLIQDDDTFNAAQINLGAFGVIHSLVLATVPKFYLESHDTPTTVSEVQKLFANGNVYNVTENGGAPEWAMKSGPALPGQKAKLYQLSICFNPYADAAQISGSTKFALDKEPFDLGRRVDRQLLNAIPRGEWARPLVDNWMLNQFPWFTSLLMNATEKIDGAAIPGFLQATVTGADSYKNRGYNVFFGGDFLAETPARFCELNVPLRGDLWLKAIPVLQKAARDWAKMHGQYQTGPTNIRFIKKSSALLGRDEDFASFECLFSGAPAYADQMINYYRECLQKALGEAVVSMHFGQESPGVTGAQIEQQFPGYKRWRQIRDRFDPLGQMLNTKQETIFPPVTAKAPVGASGALTKPGH